MLYTTQKKADKLGGEKARDTVDGQDAAPESFDDHGHGIHDRKLLV